LNRAVKAGPAARPSCGSCGSSAVLPLVYGAPNEDLAPLFAARLIAPGGAMSRLAVRSGAHWVCMGCGARWRGGLFGGGSGDAPGDPVAICGIDHHPARIRAECMYLVERFGLPASPTPGHGWRVSAQAVAGAGDQLLDMLTVRFPDGHAQVVYFTLPPPF
jgi:hypothetical protein